MLTGAVVPTTFLSVSGGLTDVTLRGIDLSAFTGAGKTLVNVTGNAAVRLFDCRVGASITTSTTPTQPAGIFDLVRTDSGATNYRVERYGYRGTQTTETTIVRAGGASDGTTPVSWKFVTTANVNWVTPFISFPIAVWNDTVLVSKTITIFGIWGGASVPNNDDIWIELFYLGSTAAPLGFYVNTSKSDGLATGTALPSDSSTWGAGSTTPFKMTISITPQLKGPVNLVIKAAKPSSTFYIDPLIQVM
jgi:hypothetical protein